MTALRKLPPETRTLLRGYLQDQAEPPESYTPHTPTAKQAEFLGLDCREALYGGAAGGGKSDALLMGALAYVHVPNYTAILFRRTYADLSLPGALMDRAHEWLGGSDAHWSERDKTWTFPRGAKMVFGYLDAPRDHFRYQSAEFQSIGFDELTQFEENQYRYLFSRLRRLKGSAVPLKMRAASNPGGIGHEWVKARFIDYEGADRRFVPARLDDNPYLDAAEYDASLAQLDPVTRAQLRHGDWTVRPEGGMFKRAWLNQFVDEVPVDTTFVRYWDKAGTAGGGAYIAGALWGRYQGHDGLPRFFSMDMVRGQWSAGERENVIEQTANLDRDRYGPEVQIWVEQEPGSGGKESAENTVRRLAGFPTHIERVTGEKVVRAAPLASQCEAGNVWIVRGSWNGAWIDEMCAFPEGAYLDQVDASGGAFNKLARPRRELRFY